MGVMPALIIKKGERMKLELEIFDAFCATKVFVVNGVSANVYDFGSQYDHDKENAEEYGCGDMRFDQKPSTSEVLKKYGITDTEYNQICGKLGELSFGSCGWCV
jgi:hypothetical protein